MCGCMDGCGRARTFSRAIWSSMSEDPVFFSSTTRSHWSGLEILTPWSVVMCCLSWISTVSFRRSSYLPSAVLEFGLVAIVCVVIPIIPRAGKSRRSVYQAEFRTLYIKAKLITVQPPKDDFNDVIPPVTSTNEWNCTII